MKSAVCPSFAVEVERNVIGVEPTRAMGDQDAERMALDQSVKTILAKLFEMRGNIHDTSSFGFGGTKSPFDTSGCEMRRMSATGHSNVDHCV